MLWRSGINIKLCVVHSPGKKNKKQLSLCFLFLKSFCIPPLLCFLISDSDFMPVVCVCVAVPLKALSWCLYIEEHCFGCQQATLFSSELVDENSLTLALSHSHALKWSCKIIIFFIECFCKAFCLQN